MTAEEFKAATRGITTSRLQELLGRGASAIYSYREGKAPIPVEVAKKAIAIRRSLEAIESSVDPSRPRYRAVVDGKLYDCNSAEWIYGPLFRTKNGEFFIADESEVSPIPMKEARKMIEGRSVDLYFAVFGEPPEA